MTTTAERPPARHRITAEVALLALVLLSPVLLAVEWGDVYSGLPAHPLLVHVPVVLVPLAALAAIVLAARPDLTARWGLATGVLALAALGGTFLAVGSGEALRDSLPADERFSDLVAEHAEAAELLRTLTFGFVVALALALLAVAANDGRLALPGPLARIARERWVRIALRVLVVVLAIACIAMVIRTGDLGAKAVWQEQ